MQRSHREAWECRKLSSHLSTLAWYPIWASQWCWDKAYFHFIYFFYWMRRQLICLEYADSWKDISLTGAPPRAWSSQCRPSLAFYKPLGFLWIFFFPWPRAFNEGSAPLWKCLKKNYLKKFWLVLITKQNKSWHLREILCAKWLLPQPKNTSFNSIHAVNCMAALGGSRHTQLSSCFQKMKIQVMVICHNSPWWAVGEISYYKLFLTLKNSYVMVDMCPTCYVIKYTDTPGLNNINSTRNSCPINPLNEFSKVISHFCFSKKSENLYDT